MLEKIFSLQQKGQKMRKAELDFDPEKQVITGKRRILSFPLLISNSIKHQFVHTQSLKSHQRE